MNYLVENLECERAFLRRLWGMWHNLAPMINALGLNPHFCWALIEVEMRDLAPPVDGDIDILVGKMAWDDSQQFDVALAEHLKRVESSHPNAIIHLMSPENFAADVVAESGGLRWPPPVDYMAGVEVKCSRLSSEVDPQREDISERNMRSTKTSWRKTEKIRSEINKLIHLGCNKVALLDLIANPPAEGINMDAWLTASIIADKTEQAMSRATGGRLPANSIAGHWVYSMGAVTGGDEILRGTGLPRQYRAAQENSYTEGGDVHNRRLQMEQSVTGLLGRLGKPRWLPALFINCRTCRTIHACGMGIACCE